MGNVFSIFFINPITNLLIFLYQLLLFLHIPYPLGFAIILLTALIRLILYPFVASQIRASYKMQKIAPQAAALREKHKEDKKKQQEEMMKLYREHGINPAAGCLPMVIQLPVIWSLYNVLTHVVGASSAASLAKINALLYSPSLHVAGKTWDTLFFGLPLASSPAKLFSHYPVIILVPVITGVFQFVLSKMMLSEDAPKQEKHDDFASAFQTQSLFIFPVMIGFFSYSLPIGLSLYWNTFTIFGILQQYLLVGAGGAIHWIRFINKNYGKK